MSTEHEIVRKVFAARENPQLADDFIRSYIPFIRQEASRFLVRHCTEQDDEYSIAMIAFHEAMEGYRHERGGFLRYAAMTIRSRLIDYTRKEARHRDQLSLEDSADEDDTPLLERLADPTDAYGESAALEATQWEIGELAAVMTEYGVTFADVADNSPKQSRTLEACGAVVRYAGENPEILTELLATKKLPMAKLAAGTGVERKTLERHRRYLLVLLLVQTNGYEIIRGHLRHVLKRRDDK